MSRQLNNLTTDKRAIGRPLDLDQKVIAITVDYVKNYAKYGDITPSVAGLACRLEKNKATLYRWVKENRSEDFNDAMSRISSAQERSLLNGGLSGELNPTITKLCLVTNHGYSENNQQDTGITINIDRSCGGTVEVSKGDQAITIDHDESS